MATEYALRDKIDPTYIHKRRFTSVENAHRQRLLMGPYEPGQEGGWEIVSRRVTPWEPVETEREEQS